MGKKRSRRNPKLAVVNTVGLGLLAWGAVGFVARQLGYAPAFSSLTGLVVSGGPLTWLAAASVRKYRELTKTPEELLLEDARKAMAAVQLKERNGLSQLSFMSK